MRAVTVGTFDGVHRGHLEVIRELKRVANQSGLTPAVITFDRHPLEIIAPEKVPKTITPPEDADLLLCEEGVETIRIPFNEELRRKTAGEWISELSDKYDAKVIVIGYDNRFGSDCRKLGSDDFIRIGAERGVKVITAPEVEGCSSSAVRKAVSEGDIEKANYILGRSFSIKGKVIHGRQLGRSIDVPTANLCTRSGQLMPKPGVYAAEAVTEAGKYRAVVNIGVNPTVCNDSNLKTEAHLIGYSGNLYDKELRLEFLRRIRDEKKFDSLAELKAQIKSDIEKAQLPIH